MNVNRLFATICIAANLFAFVSFSACTPIIEEEKTGAISGIIADNTTGEPIPTVSLELQPKGLKTVTGSDGYFSFTDLEPGEYSISYSKKGYKDGTDKISVQAGKTQNAHMLIERIPAIITADKEVLDFGANSGVTSLSFNIVNSSWKPLEWTIDCTCIWVRQDGIKPAKKGILNYGKTATIIVEIDRNELEAGNNETYLVIYSEDGSAEVKLTAVGAETRTPALIVSEASEITSSSAVLHGEIKDPGTPEYFERGFVFSLEQNPTIEGCQAVTSPKTEERTFSYNLENLSLGKTYHVKSYAKNLDKGKEVVTYSSNEITFTIKASAPSVSVLEASELNISQGTATLNGKIDYAGDPVYKEKGFVYATTNSPAADDFRIAVAGTERGSYRAGIRNLEVDTPYYVRAYVIGETGIVYSAGEIKLTLASSAPEVAVLPASDLNVTAGTVTLNGNLSSTGEPAYTEKGFVYATHNNPTIEDDKVVAGGNATGLYSVGIANIPVDTKYYVRAFASNINSTAYSTDEIVFELKTTSPSVTLTSVTNLDLIQRSVTLKADILEKGVPEYTERGFAYAEHPNPTADDNYMPVSGKGKGKYETNVSGLSLDTKYYARAYLVNQLGTFYSPESLNFTLTSTAPEVSSVTVTESSYSGKAVTLNAEVTEAGSPGYTEKGFVYGNSPYPAINSSNIVRVSGTSAGKYYARLTSLIPDCNYYARAYIIGAERIVYGPEATFRITPKAASVSIGEPADADIENRTIRLNGTIDDAGDPAYTEKGFIYGTASVPVLENSSIVPVEISSSYFTATLKDIEINRQYYARAYVTNEAGTSYSEIKTFLLKAKSAGLSISPNYTLDMDSRAITVSAKITSLGTPKGEERGFVFSTTTTHPTVENNEKMIVVPGIDTDTFNGTLTDIQYDRIYYCRAYAKSKLGTVYNQRYGNYANTEYLSISTAQADVAIEAFKLLSSDRATASMNLSYRISYPGRPTFTETGIVLSTANSLPTVNDTKVIVSGRSTDGDFTAHIDNLDNSKIYYARAYATNNKGSVYSESTVVYLGPEYLEFPDAGFAMHSDYSNEAKWQVAANSCSSSRVGGYDNWRLPSMAELIYMASHANKTFYLPLPLWSNEAWDPYGNGSTAYHYYLTSQSKQDYAKGSQYFRCVRSMDGSSGSQNSSIKVTTSDVVSSHRYKVVTGGNGSSLRVSYDSKATLEGAIELNGNATYAERGFILSKSGTPEYDTADLKRTVSGTESGKFTCTVSGLGYKLTYHFRAYAKTESGDYIYGESKTFAVTTSD